MIISCIFSAQMPGDRALRRNTPALLPALYETRNIFILHDKLKRDESGHLKYFLRYLDMNKSISPQHFGDETHHDERANE
jgi:hypothetical protein